MMPMKNSGKSRMEYRERNLRILLEYIHYGTYKKVGELEGVTGERIRQIKEWTLFHLFGHSRESSPQKALRRLAQREGLSESQVREAMRRQLIHVYRENPELVFPCGEQSLIPTPEDTLIYIHTAFFGARI